MRSKSRLPPTHILFSEDTLSCELRQAGEDLFDPVRSIHDTLLPLHLICGMLHGNGFSGPGPIMPMIPTFSAITFTSIPARLHPEAPGHPQASGRTPRPGRPRMVTGLRSEQRLPPDIWHPADDTGGNSSGRPQHKVFDSNRSRKLCGTPTIPHQGLSPSVHHYHKKAATGASLDCAKTLSKMP